jgi:multidrug efflux pump
MARFFIDRPVFAWVIALFIIVLGGASIVQLPIAQYPSVAPPSIAINVTYPGASAQTLDESVISVIELELNGAQGLAYTESVSQSNGTGTITVTFEPGTDIDLAQIEVQNRLARATPRLPAAVTQQGVRVDKSRSNFLLVVTMISDGALDGVALGDYAARNVLPEIQRIPGVGQASLFGTERAMRVWIDPAKLVGYNLSAGDVTNAIRAQNSAVPAGGIGQLPNPADQTMAVTVVVAGQLTNVDEFGAIVLRANPDGSRVLLRDVARVELGAQTFVTSTRKGGRIAAGIGVQLTPSGNAMAASKAIRARMEQLKPFLPAHMSYDIPYDTSRFVQISIEEVVRTLVEAVLLVFVVMYIFLQNIRYTLIPTMVVPIALLGTFGVMLALGFSINVLTMFGLVLAIGILVDDAIVVVENVERIMSEEGLSPREATRKAMSQISGAIVGITVVLVSVFLPMAFFSGSVGNIYRQFSLSMASSMLFSALMALSLTPALCATMLKPVAAGHHHEKRGFFGWFNRGFNRTAKGYQGWVGRILKRGGRMMAIFAVLVAVVGWMYARMPGSFLPNEDQGYIVVNFQLPPGASQNRTLEVVRQAEDFFLKQPEVQDMISILGFSFSGQGQNAGMAFVMLKDWGERKGEAHDAQAVAARGTGALSHLRDAFIFAVSPPPIAELGNATGFSLRLQDRAGLGHEALLGARNQLLGLASTSALISGARPDGLEDAPQLQVDIDRQAANAQGVGFEAISSVLSTALGSSYANDFPSAGRLQRVIVQADAPARMQPEDLLQLNVINNQGRPVPLSAFATTHWINGQMQAVRYNGYPSMRIAGDASPGHSTGEAMAEIERLVKQLPPGVGYEWTGQSREEKLSGSQASILLAFSLLAVFLCLAALYESWSIPLAVILVVPLGVLGALLGATMRGMPNDVYFKVGLITIIGLSAKNAVLIVEFAKDLQAQGKGLIEATLEACHLRFRPILMTSFAFILGVLPLAIASGAGSASQRAIGTGVLGGMISATVLAVLFVPVFFVVVRRLFRGSERQRQLHAHEIDGPPPGPAVPLRPAEHGPVD